MVLLIFDIIKRGSATLIHAFIHTYMHIYIRTYIHYYTHMHIALRYAYGCVHINVCTHKCNCSACLVLIKLCYIVYVKYVWYHHGNVLSSYCCHDNVVSMNNVHNCPRDYGKWSCHWHNYELCSGGLLEMIL